MVMADQGMPQRWQAGLGPLGLAPWPEIYPTRCTPVEGDELLCHRGAINGLERRLERSSDKENEDSLSLARIILSQHYAAFATAMIRRLGGDVRGLKTLTDRNNIVPLARHGADICNTD